MAGNARMTDLWVGTCSCHPPLPPISMSGPIITGSGDRTVNFLGQARATDLVMGWCGHVGYIVTGSPNAMTNNLGNARVGDIVAGCTVGVISTCSPDVTSN